MSEIKFYNNCQEFFRSLIADLKGSHKVDISTLSASVQSSASIFDINHNNILDSEELDKFLDSFSKADTDSNKKLSDAEINAKFNSLNSSFKKVSTKNKKQLLTEVYSKVLAQEIKSQIDGLSIASRTENRLKKINSDNVYDVLKEYRRISPNESLASAIDNELNLNISHVKEYICKPLKEKAWKAGITNIGNYESISDIKKINVYIRMLEKKIKEATEPVFFQNNEMFIRPSIEDHVINHATDKNGNKLTYFSRIPALREKGQDKLTAEEKNLVNEFNNYISIVCKVGKEYGVDPKKIIAITQKEVACKGLNTLANGKPNNVTGGNGKGYMQITSVCVVELFEGKGNSIKNATYSTDRNKIHVYGKEMENLLKSKGFNVNCKKGQKKAEVQKIWDYISSNKDPEFNIRFGVLWLRHRLKKANGDIKKAAINYNGHPKHKYEYGDSVNRFYNQLVANQRKFIN